MGPAAREATPALMKLLQDTDAGVRIPPAEALLKINPSDRAALPVLLAALVVVAERLRPARILGLQYADPKARNGPILVVLLAART